MSKIEKALNKARGARPSAAIGSSGQLVPMSAAVARPAEPTREMRSASIQEIARMAEPIKRKESELEERKIIAPDMNDARVANAFRQLRTRLLEKSGGKSSTVLITSVGAHHGTSFISLNLAVAFSFDESKTALLIDCNLASPAFDDLAYPARFPGLSDYFETAGLRVEELIHPTGIQRLRLIPAGEPGETATEHFTSTKMRQLLDSIKQRYLDRFIFIDAPPVLDAADTRILAEQCDYVLLVVPYGKVVESHVQAAVKAIGPEKLAGVIFNNEPNVATQAWNIAKDKALALLRRKVARTDGRLARG